MSYLSSVGRIRSTLAVAAMLSTLLAPSPSKARELDIELFGQTLSPQVLIAAPGDLIDITSFDGVHQLASYASVGTLNPDQTRGQATQFQTPILRGSQFDPASSGFEFLGGTLRYRCTRHSILSPVNGVCDGMCGVVTEEDTMPAAPAIDQPSRVIRERPATISGAAEPMTIVEMREGSTYDTGIYRGQGLADENGRWSVKTVDFGAIQGPKRLIARTVRGVGYVSGDSAMVIYQYVPDIVPPDIEFDPVASQVAVGTFKISGRVRDNVGVAAVAIDFSRPDINTANVQSTSKIFRLPAVCDPLCPQLVANTWIPWSFEVDLGKPEPATGLYTIAAIGFDTSFNVDSAKIPTLGNLLLYLRAPCVGVPDNPPPIPDGPPPICVTAEPVPPVLESATPTPIALPTL